MKTSQKIMLGLLLITGLGSCKEDTPEPKEVLPPITSVGANTFGCLVNGELFIAGRGKEGVWMPIYLGYSHYSDSVFSLFAHDYNSNISLLLETIYYQGENSISLYNPNSRKRGSITQLDDFSVFPNERYFIDSLYPSHLKISADNEKFISGTFSFRGIGEFSKDTVNITEGRFDVRKDI